MSVRQVINGLIKQSNQINQSNQMNMKFQTLDDEPSFFFFFLFQLGLIEYMSFSPHRQVCNGNDEDQENVLCDCCDFCYHLACLPQDMQSIPSVGSMLEWIEMMYRESGFADTVNLNQVGVRKRTKQGYEFSMN